MEIERLFRIMRSENLDAVVAVSPEMVYYTSGALIHTQKTVRSRLALTIFPLGGDPVIIVCSIEESFTREWTWIKELRAYVEYKQSPIKLLAETLEEKKLTGKRIGLEMNYLFSSFYQELTSLLPSTTFLNCENVFVQMRMIKSRKEIELLENATKATVKAVENAFAKTKPGDSERQLYNRLAINIIQTGAEEIAFNNVAAGKKGVQGHPIADDTLLLEGETLRIDSGGLFKGYFTDVARTIAIGKPTQRQRDYYSKLQKIQKKVIDNMLIGTRCSLLFEMCIKEFEKEGMTFHMPHIGHGMGLILHEHPMISPLCHAELEKGMVINVEPVFKDLEGNAGYHIEDLVEITESGPRVLTGTDFSTEIRSLG